MKSWERWVVLGALLLWPLAFGAVSTSLRLDPTLSNVLLVAGWATILGVFGFRIYKAAEFLRSDVARARASHPHDVISAVILTASGAAASNSIVVLVADARGVLLVGRDEEVVRSALWRSVLKLSPLDKNFVLTVATPEGLTEEWRITPCETDFIRAVSVEKRDALLAQLEGLRADAA